MAGYMRAAVLLLGAVAAVHAKSYGYITEVDNYSLLVRGFGPICQKFVAFFANNSSSLGSLRNQRHYLQLRPTDLLDKLR